VDGYVYLDDTGRTPGRQHVTELQPAGVQPSKRIYSSMAYDSETGG